MVLFSYLSQKIGRKLDAQRDLRFYQVICGGLALNSADQRPVICCEPVKAVICYLRGFCGDLRFSGRPPRRYKYRSGQHHRVDDLTPEACFAVSVQSVITGQMVCCEH